MNQKHYVLNEFVFGSMTDTFPIVDVVVGKLSKCYDRKVEIWEVPQCSKVGLERMVEDYFRYDSQLQTIDWDPYTKCSMRSRLIDEFNDQIDEIVDDISRYLSESSFDDQTSVLNFDDPNLRKPTVTDV